MSSGVEAADALEAEARRPAQARAVRTRREAKRTRDPQRKVWNRASLLARSVGPGHREVAGRRTIGGMSTARLPRLLPALALALAACDDAPLPDTAPRPLDPNARPAGLPPAGRAPLQRPEAPPKPAAPEEPEAPAVPDVVAALDLIEAVERARVDPTTADAARERLGKARARFPGWGRPALEEARLGLFAATSGLRADATPAAVAPLRAKLDEARKAAPAPQDPELAGTIEATAALLALFSGQPAPAELPALPGRALRLAQALGGAEAARLPALQALRDDGAADTPLRLDTALALRRLAPAAEKGAATAAALALAPTFDELRLDRAEELLAAKTPVEAAAEADRALEAPPTPERAKALALRAHREALRKVEKEQGLAHVGDHVKRVAALAPDDPDAHVDLARYWAKIGVVTTNADFLRDAKAELQKALALKPGYPRAQAELVKLGNARLDDDHDHDHE